MLYTFGFSLCRTKGELGSLQTYVTVSPTLKVDFVFDIRSAWPTLLFGAAHTVETVSEKSPLTKDVCSWALICCGAL